jgi:hypothetical protein
LASCLAPKAAQSSRYTSASLDATALLWWPGQGREGGGSERQCMQDGSHRSAADAANAQMLHAGVHMQRACRGGWPYGRWRQSGKDNSSPDAQTRLCHALANTSPPPPHPACPTG